MERENWFLREYAGELPRKKLAVSTRFRDENGQVQLWEIRALSAREERDIGWMQPRRDRYLAALAAACTLYPDLNRRELQDSYGAMGAADLLGNMLTGDEYQKFLMEVLELNGFLKPERGKINGDL